MASQIVDVADNPHFFQIIFNINITSFTLFSLWFVVSQSVELAVYVNFINYCDHFLDLLCLVCGLLKCRSG